MQRQTLKSVVKFILENATSTSPVEYKDILEHIPILKSTLSRMTKKIKNRLSLGIRVTTDPFDKRRVLFYVARGEENPTYEQLTSNKRETNEQLMSNKRETNEHAAENGEIATKSLPGATLDPHGELEEKNPGYIKTLNNISHVFSSAKNLEGDSKEKVEDQNLMTSQNPFMSPLGEECLKALNEMETPETPSSDKASLLISGERGFRPNMGKGWTLFQAKRERRPPANSTPLLIR